MLCIDLHVHLLFSRNRRTPDRIREYVQEYILKVESASNNRASQWNSERNMRSLHEEERVECTGCVKNTESREFPINIPEYCEAYVDEKISTTSCYREHANGWDYCASAIWPLAIESGRVIHKMVMRIRKIAETTPIVK